MGTHTFRASDDLSRAIDDRCLAENINKSELIIRAIESYLAGVIQPVKQDVIQTDIDDRFEALESRIEQYLSGVIQPVKQDVLQTEIDDRFQALESEIKAIREQLKAIVNAGKSPQKTEPKALPKKVRTIAPGVGTIAKVSWKSLIAEFPDKNLDELCEIARERYPKKEQKEMRYSIRRAMGGAKSGKQPLNLAPLPKG